MKKEFWMAGLAIACAIVLVGCTAASGNPAATPGVAGNATSAPVRVEMRGNTFIPASLTIKAGTAVTWWNMDFASHTVHADDESFKSSMIPGGQSYSFVFPKAGSYRYYSDGEGGPRGKGMSGLVEVTP
jgi:plastocyanin